MTQRERFLTLVLTVLLLAAGVAACRWWRAESCSQCGRDECKNLTFTIELEGAAFVRTCCPRCALRYIQEKRPVVVSLAVREFETAAPLDARKALYVEGSDVHPCTHDVRSTPTDERGCCLETVYDRCEPSLIAFASVAGAEAFAREHGGFVRSFDALASSDLRRR
jgi:hypothetical protein